MPTPAIFFDDAHGKLMPLDDLRPRALIRTGGLTTLARHQSVLDLAVIAAFVRAIPVDLARELFAADGLSLLVNAVPPDAIAAGMPILLINSRCALPWPLLRQLEVGTLLLEEESGHAVAAMVKPEAAEALLAHLAGDAPAATAPAVTTDTMPGPALLARPWHARHFRDAAISTDLSMLQLGGENLTSVPGCTIIGMRPLTIAATAKIYPGTIFDCEAGGIHICDGAVIRPGCTLIGPVIIGEGTTVLDRAIIKSNSAIGPLCKVAGEVGGTIFQGCSNKAHDGHLGDSWIGQWVNLGAGTTNSNLLSTYGQVSMRVSPISGFEPTGQQFMGCIIGDHCKLAISTRIMTGAILRTGIMWAAAAAVATTVPAFAWVTDSSKPGEVFFRSEKFLDIARLVMGRRNIEMTPAYAAALSGLMAANA